MSVHVLICFKNFQSHSEQNHKSYKTFHDLVPSISLISSTATSSSLLYLRPCCIFCALRVSLRVFRFANLSAWNVLPPDIQMLAPFLLNLCSNISLSEKLSPTTLYSKHSATLPDNIDHQPCFIYFHIIYQHLAPTSKLSLNINGHCGQQYIFLL